MDYNYVNGLQWKDHLDLARMYANKSGGCNKVLVGSVIAKDNAPLVFGANKCIPNLCKTPRGCLRIEKYGEDSKAHRDPGDCRAIHSEIDAIARAARTGVSVQGATIYVTRYPCESCAKAIIAAGISRVVYGGTTRVSDTTKTMFDSYGVDCIYSSNWEQDFSDR